MNKIIDNITDLKKCTPEELSEQTRLIRAFLIQSVTETGGHLSSNLGAVELTAAMHYVFDSPKDSIIWDVGHQCYTHKILTGRKDLFPTLRQKNGLSGYPSPAESNHDAIHAGHSSSSISVCTGIATAKKLDGDPSRTIAVIGDGSFTGGDQVKGRNVCAGKYRCWQLSLTLFTSTCPQKFPLRGLDTAEIYLDSWCVLNDTDQICLIQQGDGV